MAQALLDPKRLPSPEAIEAELARRTLLDFTTFTFPGYRPNWHHLALCAALDRFVAGSTRFLMVFLPAQNGKSELVSRRLPAYLLGRDPDVRVIACSYSADLASAMNRDVQRIMESEAYRMVFQGTQIPEDNARTIAGRPLRNSEMFEIVGRRGYYKCAGVGGSITGRSADVAIIDDPVKNRAEAESKTYRDGLWEWYGSTLRQRLTSDAGRILLCMTRWHEGDLAGRLIDAMQQANSDQWEVVSFPAIAEEPLHHSDPRQIGDALWPERYPLSELAARRVVSGSYEWAGMYQQRPAPAEGGMIKRHWWRFYSVRPERFDEVIQSWDCLDDQTEILTENGWAGCGEVKEGDRVYSLHLPDQALQLTPVVRYGSRFVRPGERFTRISSIRMDVRVTEGHVFHVGVPAGGRKYRRVEQRKVTGAELVAMNRSYRLPISGVFDFHGVSLTDDELRFIAWFMTDGGFANQYVQIVQSKNPYVDEIRDLLKRLRFDFIERTMLPTSGFPNGKPAQKFLVPKGTKTGKYLRNGWARLALWLDKELAPNIMQMSRRQFGVFWQELMKGDGDASNGYLCCGARKILADRLQAMAVTRGYASSLHSRPSSSSGNMMWYVSARERQWTQSNPQVKTASRLTLESPAKPNEVVWCVQNKNGTIITRRNGKVAILGNCTFKATADTDYVAGHVWGRVGADCYLLDRVHDRLTFTQTIAAVRTLSEKWPAASAKLVEDAANGPAVIDALNREIPGLIAVKPDGGKVARLVSVSPNIEAGNVWLPDLSIAPWVNEVIESAAVFPNGAHDDDEDAMSQALRRLYAANTPPPAGGTLQTTERPSMAYHAPLRSRWR